MAETIEAVGIVDPDDRDALGRRPVRTGGRKPGRPALWLAKAEDGPLAPDEASRRATERVRDEARDVGGRWTIGAGRPPLPSEITAGSPAGPSGPAAVPPAPAAPAPASASAPYWTAALPPLTTLPTGTPNPIGTPRAVSEAASRAIVSLWEASLPAGTDPGAARFRNQEHASYLRYPA